VQGLKNIQIVFQNTSSIIEDHNNIEVVHLFDNLSRLVQTDPEISTLNGLYDPESVDTVNEIPQIGVFLRYKKEKKKEIEKNNDEEIYINPYSTSFSEKVNIKNSTVEVYYSMLRSSSLDIMQYYLKKIESNFKITDFNLIGDESIRGNEILGNIIRNEFTISLSNILGINENYDHIWDIFMMLKDEINDENSSIVFFFKLIDEINNIICLEDVEFENDLKFCFFICECLK
jgi:hypothetical protein